MKLSSTGVGFLFVASVIGFVACSESAPATDPPATITPPAVDAGTPEPSDAGASSDAPLDTGPKLPTVRIAAANTTSGTATTYDSPESIRIFQGLKPDVVLLQEFRYRTGAETELREFVTTAFGASYNYYREPALTNNDIPNGIVSRWPIVESGSWDDPNVDNRGFAWAKIAIPDAPHPLWAVSLHLLTSSAANRAAEAVALVAKIKEVVPASDYLVVGGDLNTSVRTEACIATVSEVVVASAPYPDDGAGNENTNGPRTKALDWLLADPDLAALSVPVSIGARSFPAGLVFDSRTYEPLADVAPIQVADSDALNMQHMPVVRDFAIPR